MQLYEWAEKNTKIISDIKILLNFYDIKIHKNIIILSLFKDSLCNVFTLFFSIDYYTRSGSFSSHLFLLCMEV